MIFFDKMINGERVIVRPSELHDICMMKDNLRDEDRMEVWAAFNQSPERNLLIGYLGSTMCWTVLIDGRPIMMYGCIPEPNLPTHANVWMLGTPEVAKIKKTFVRQTKIFIGIMLNHYPVLYNWVDNRYKQAIKWLEMVGAEMEPASSFGADRELFNYFTIKKRD